ncbi:MAG: DUF1573 domain-containing protein [Gemmataceae bacterium]
MGTGREGQELVKVFRFSNSGRAPLNFNIQASCSCSSVEPQEGTVAPGATQKVRVAVKLRTPGQDEVVGLRMTTNDADNELVAMNLLATCVAPINVSPQTADFGDVPIGTEPTKRLRLRDAKDAPFTDASSLTVKSSSPDLIADVVPDADRTLALSLRLATTMPPGAFLGHVALSAKGDDQALEVPVRANVREVLNVTPTTLYLTATDSAASLRGTVLAWRTDGKPLARLASFEAPEGVEIKNLDDANAVRRRLAVTLSDVGTAFEQVDVMLHFEGCDSPVKLRVRTSRGRTPAGG